MKENSVLQRLLLHKVGMIIVGIQLIIVILLSITIGRFHVLPSPLFIGMILIEFVYVAIMFLGQMVKNKLHYITKVITVFGIVISGLVLFTVNNGYVATNKMTGKSQETKTINVVALKDDEAEVLEDLKEIRIGIVKGKNDTPLEEMITYMKNTIQKEIETEEYEDYFSMVEALYNREIEVIAVDDAFVPLIEESYSSYQSDTKSLYVYEYTIEVQLDNSTKVLSDNESSVNEEKEITERSFNVFLSGIDISGSIDKVSRCDVNMIATVNPVTKQILLTSTPRDYYVKTTVSGDMRDKLTHAGIYGIEASVGTLEELYGVSIEYYVKVNFTGFQDIVDALNGITVYSENDFTTGQYHFIVGENECDGEKALAFVRDRYSFASGDLMRNRNQQAVVEGIINKITTPSALLNINSLLNVASECAMTNMELSDLMKLVNMQLTDGAKWTVTTVGVSGTGASEITYSNQKQKSYVMYPDEEQVKEASEKMQEVFAAK